MTGSVASVWGMTRNHSALDPNRPGSLIAAIPAILGFVPEKSLVLVSLHQRGPGREMGAVMRVDLEPDLISGVDRLADVAATARPDGAIAVIVDADGARCPVCNEDHRELSAALADALEERGITLWAVHVVDEVGPGGRWHCVDGCGCRGDVDDPAASPVTAAAVLDGRRLYARRADLQAVIAVTDPARTASLTQVLERHATARSERREDDPDTRCRDDIEHVMDMAGQLAGNAVLADDDIAVLGCAMTDVAVRDTLYALAVGESAGAAESLWAVLARTLPERWRVEALVLLAFSAYARGDGPLAGVSLEAALQIDPTHRMAGMLDMALQSGMQPQQIRELAGTGYRLAAQFGVRLPPPQAYGRRAV